MIRATGRRGRALNCTDRPNRRQISYHQPFDAATRPRFLIDPRHRRRRKPGVRSRFSTAKNRDLTPRGPSGSPEGSHAGRCRRHGSGGRRGRTPLSADQGAGEARGASSAVPTGSSISRSATASTRGYGKSSSRSSKSLSLGRHIRMGWSVVADELGEFIEILALRSGSESTSIWAPQTRCFRTCIDSPRGPAPSHRAVRRSRLQDGLRADAGRSPRARCGSDHRRHRDTVGGSQPLRRHAGGRPGPVGGLPRKAQESRTWPVGSWRRWGSTSST